METKTPIHVSAICGSLREGSYTRIALEIALQGAKDLGATVELIDLREYILPFKGMPENDTDVELLRANVRKAQGLILGTPVYHGGISGVLKNAIDLMGSDHFGGRVVGLVGVGGGSMGAGVPLASLRDIGRSVGAWVIPHEASVANSKSAFTPDGLPKDDNLTQRLLKVGRDVARFAYLHHSEQTQQLVEMWESSVEKSAIER